MAKHRASRKHPPKYRRPSASTPTSRVALVTGAALAMTVVGAAVTTQDNEVALQPVAEGVYPSLNLPVVTPLGVPIAKVTKEAPLTTRFEDRLRAAMNQGVADAELRVTSVDRTRSSSGGPRASSHTPRAEATTPRAVPPTRSGVAPGTREELGADDARRDAGVPAAEAGGGTVEGERKTPCPPTTTVPVQPPVTEKPEPTAEPTPTPVTEAKPDVTPEPEPEPEPEAPQPAPVIEENVPESPPAEDAGKIENVLTDSPLPEVDRAPLMS